MNVAELTRAFLDRRILGPAGPFEPARAVVTRKSLLLFTPDLVLKLRRPLFVDGQDQSLVSVRVATSARERFIGRQLSPDVYLEEVALRLDQAGEACVLQPGWAGGEPVVLMKRLPDERRADHVLLSGLSSEEKLRQLELAMQQLARFHVDAEFHTEPPLASVDRPGARFHALMDRLAGALGAAERDALLTETNAWLERLAPTFDHRIRERRVRSLHGEIRLEHLYLPGEVRASGALAIAFIDSDDGPDDGRVIDTAEEVMSLALELDAIAGTAFSDRVVDAYAGQTTDASLRKVARFYKRLGCLRRAAEALVDAAAPGANVAEERERARFFIERALAC